ncbi:MAG: hypothetical protein IPG71_04225 [bacterium]|nr:hypothetical protein [bacterium]
MRMMKTLLLLVLVVVGQVYADMNAEGIDFYPESPIYLGASSELEQQILDLERRLQNAGHSSPLDDVTYAQLKAQLNALYEQRPREHDPLDDGADACPAVDMPNNIQPWTDYGTTIGAANNFTPEGPCPIPSTPTAPDKIYRFVPANTGNYIFDTQGSDFDTYLSIRTGGACPGTTQLDCNDDYYGLQSRVQAWLYAGQSYWIIVDGWFTYSGNFVLNLNIDCGPVGNQNDWQQECAEAVGDPSHAAWDCNGGCNNQWYGGFPQWQPMNLCQFQRGECFTYQDPNNISIRDNDSYFFTLTEPCSLSLTMFATFSYNVQINEYGFCLPQNFVSLLNIPACNGGTYVTQCLPAGTYSFELSPNFYSGMTTPKSYLFKIDPIPCSGCRVDGSFMAPASFTANGCDGISHNSLRPSDDATYCVVIPYASDWTFQLCNTGIGWNNYLYLTSECSGGIIAQSEDGCGPNGHAKIDCVPLQPGNYYLTIEGVNAWDCAQFYLQAFVCAGSCCYGGDYYNRQCAFMSQSECAQLGGEFTQGQQCAPEVCGVRPQCEDSSQLAQLPHLPTEAWTAIASDTYINYGLWEDYGASGPISSIRFWGLFTDYTNGQPCINQPCSFQITFVDSSAGPAVQTYNASAIGYLMPQNYGPNFPVYQYDVDLPTDCNILSGRVQVKSTDGDACVFAWVSSPQGNGNVVIHTSGGPTVLPVDMSLCLERGCAAPDSVFIEIFQTNFYPIHFRQVEQGYATLWHSTNVDAIFPATYTAVAGAYLPAGYYLIQHNSIDPQERYVVTNQCGPPPIAIERSDIFQLIE